MALSPQTKAPNFTKTALVDGEIKEISLSDFAGKHLVLFFYPLDFTFVCPTEIHAYNDRAEEFKAMGAEVVGCSIDSEFVHLAWTNTPRAEGGIEDVTIPLIADIGGKLADAFGVLTEGGVALRATFIIGPDGTIRSSHVNDLPLGRSVDETLRVMKAINFTNEHGEVCPANWDEGKATIIPDPEQKKDFFKNNS
jgi:peroxiredoxin (alkyl hydroperoxide reductase subunit C)